MNMTLRQLRDRLSVLQALIASLTVLLGSGMRWSSFALAAALTVWAFYRKLPAELSPRTQRLWTAGIFVALIATLARAFLLAEFLDAGVDFLLLLIVQRLFNRQRAREHLQLLLLGTLMLVVGAVVNTGLDFPILFTAFLVVAVMTLIVNQLMSEGERLGARVEVDVQRAGRKSRSTLWRAAAAVSGLAAGGALLVFLLFPRWGVGVFLRGSMNRDTRSGFAGEVSLGEFGRIKSDASVAARLRPLTPLPPRQRLTWHLRGSAFDRYDGGRWSHTNDVRYTGIHRLQGFKVLVPESEPALRLAPGVGRGNRGLRPTPIPGFAESETFVHAQVTLEDLGVDALFAASTPLAVKLRPRGELERGRLKLANSRSEEFKVIKPPGPIQYEFISRIAQPSPDEMRAIGSPPTPDHIQPYLQRSEGLSEEFTALAKRVAASAPTHYDKADAVLGFLGDYGYTTDLRRSPRVEQGADPLEGFLFDTQEGHCEYFATAMATMLREVDVPTRIVNGYYGGHYNELGDFYAIRQADAHSWVEVYMGDLGWVTFDPTPPGGRTAGDGAPIWPAFSQAADAVRNAYLEYVIDYNLTKQLALLEDLGVRQPGGRFKVRWAGVAQYGAVVLLAVGAVWWWRRRRTPRAPAHVRLYLGLLATLAKRGYTCGPHESASRFGARLHGEGIEGADTLVAFARAYERVRFGASSDPADLSALQSLADGVRRGLPARPR